MTKATALEGLTLLCLEHAQCHVAFCSNDICCLFLQQQNITQLNFRPPFRCAQMHQSIDQPLFYIPELALETQRVLTYNKKIDILYLKPNTKKVDRLYQYKLYMYFPLDPTCH